MDFLLRKLVVKYYSCCHHASSVQTDSLTCPSFKFLFLLLNNFHASFCNERRYIFFKVNSGILVITCTVCLCIDHAVLHMTLCVWLIHLLLICFSFLRASYQCPKGLCHLWPLHYCLFVAKMWASARYLKLILRIWCWTVCILQECEHSVLSTPCPTKRPCVSWLQSLPKSPMVVPLPRSV